jgi:Domain of unknown function (DUF4188)
MAQAPQRTTAVVDGEFVVFLVGLRVNKVWRPDRWLGAILAGRAMDRALRADPASGMLDSRLVLTGRGPMFIQIWRDSAALQRFAHAPDELHQAAWKKFYRQVGRSGEVGLWHETYQVGQGKYEAMYANMPRYGLAAAGESAPIGPRGASARERMAGANAG